jgi:hypothetical protein
MAPSTYRSYDFNLQKEESVRSKSNIFKSEIEMMEELKEEASRSNSLRIA